MEGERERRQKLLSEKERQINHKKRETERREGGYVNLIESGEEMLLSQRRRPFTLCVWKLVSHGCH